MADKEFDDDGNEIVDWDSLTLEEKKAFGMNSAIILQPHELTPRDRLIIDAIEEANRLEAEAQQATVQQH